jgi:hypothetical protein
MTPSATPLFCKPLAATSHPLFSKYYEHLRGTITIQSLCLHTHLPTIHHWVNLPYAHKYWQMQGPYQQLLDQYTAIQQNPLAHSLVAYLNEELVAQIDVYSIAADEIAEHLPCDLDQCGFHLLMAPNRNPTPTLTDTLLQCFLQYIFSFPAPRKIFGEPDVSNHKANSLLRQAGFTFLKTISLSYKNAHLYCLTRSRFHQLYPP